ncbi:MAG: folate-binding protein YgfZ [Hahellaceae bacterium]|nr:folate-binding protein YgfZ [Hahellaceae bacterium]
MTAVFAAHLKHQTLIQVDGVDAGKFLQGQVTCDVLALPVGESTLGACCNNKGRMLAIFQLLRTNESAYLLRMSRAVAGELVGHLSKFKVFFKCTLQILDRSQVWGLWTGTDSHESPLNIDLKQPDSAHLSRIHLTPDQEELWLTEPSLQPDAWINANSPALTEMSEEAWQERQILLGIPALHADIIGEFIPQALNLENLQAISFTKGCYTGQEIVARTHYLGKLKKSMHLYRGAAEAAKVFAQSPKTLFTAEGSFGQIVNTLATSNDLWVLVIAENDSVAGNTPVFADSGLTHALINVPLRYTSTTK